ncbi:Type I restriction enzyme R protein N terminus (HSDR_N) [Paucidesulfovibrio gracilis DSM 16080]|uniref:Type I restriction enzyme R protein N terminus (HSDR_N) n=1 Tax=Paucidesulfovibrio gracilis DSM 16080 TaxID=1121449 RepID=A0A1T4X4E8_9BACT|nr:type I restriction enzyme HsdR N-terminal domain-containing protein [Paucidesulfovibrio gracilis]SKA84523.1 Type I restriction enzyme R protein N terminus (HSDR_N) [Paucidesulfovibrio gracilis DSM 16080]
MHEVSLGNTLRDFLTGEEIEETTYEEFRQALARLLVEERGYPREQIKAKVPFAYVVDGETFRRNLDLVVYDDAERPMLVVIFCSGSVSSFERETAIAARLVENGPAALAVVTDSKEALLLDPATREVIREGMAAIPHWEDLLNHVEEAKPQPVTEEERIKLIRIFHAYNGFLLDSCCSAECGGPFSKEGEMK